MTKTEIEDRVSELRKELDIIDVLIEDYREEQHGLYVELDHLLDCLEELDD